MGERRRKLARQRKLLWAVALDAIVYDGSTYAAVSLGDDPVTEALRDLHYKGLVGWNPEARKYRLTDKGRSQL